jgi:hypothetical protein
MLVFTENYLTSISSNFNKIENRINQNGAKATRLTMINEIATMSLEQIKKKETITQ